MVCNIKHTKYQPLNKEFKCPKCGAQSPDFCVDESENMECEKLHDTDYLRCWQCHYDTNGKTFVAFLVKKDTLVPCPCCKGRGMVKA